jgi:hypothetical protein
MSIYQTNTDIDILRQNVNRIKDEVEKKRLELSEPSQDERLKAHNIIKDFCKENKRKLYGGFALHLLLLDKNASEKIYKDDKIPDIDIYSPEPLSDMYKICNAIFQSGITCVMGQEALHPETYTIKIYNETICDLTYVPKNIYNSMQYIYVKDAGLHCIHSNFMTIDYLRMLSNPIDSYWRLLDENEDLKAFKRLTLLQKYCPLPVITNDFPPYFLERNVSDLVRTVHGFLLNKETTVTIGLYVYNYFCRLTGYTPINIPYYEFISCNYKQDTLDLIEKLKLVNQNITVTEYSPFFQYLDYNTEIHLGGSLICRIYGNNKKCIPYQDIKTDASGNKIRIGSFTVVTLYYLINAQRARVNKNDVMKDESYRALSHSIQMRNIFFAKEKCNFLSDTPFRDFVMETVGEEITSDKLMRMRIEKRKIQKKPLVHRYVPSDEYREEVPVYIFSNSSGNKIINERHLQLINKNDTDEISLNSESQEN